MKQFQCWELLREHQLSAGVIQNRYPETILEKLKEIWYRPFGLPLSITPDADTAYLGACQDWHVRVGIDYRVYQQKKLGNLERLVEEMLWFALWQKDWWTSMELEAGPNWMTFWLRSSTPSTAAPQAVFGRLPHTSR